MPNSYTGVWRAGTGAHYLWANVNWDSFRAKWQELSGQNMRLADMEVHVTDGELRYTGVWRAGTGGHYLWVNADWNGFVACDPARRAAARAAIESAPAKTSEPDHGGGDQPDPSVKGTSAPGEGGGDIGNAASVRYTVSDIGNESGGGGDLGGGFTSGDRATNDGPDGGGSIDGGSSGRGDESPHGGGRF